MLELLLFTLLNLFHINYHADLLNQSDWVKQQVIESLLDNYQPAFQIYKVAPPIKKSISVSPSYNISAKSGIAIDLMSNKVLWQKNPNEVSTIASLTKLMTALVFLDTRPDFEKEYIMSKEDENGTEGATLRVSSGEKLKVVDLFYSSLVGSANNATKALARSTGLAEEEFIKKMNEKADLLGLKQTKYFDVTGLNPENKSTVYEMAKLASYAFQNSLIKKALLTEEYTFATLDRKIVHRIKNTDVLIFDKSLKLEGAKTGYLNEAGYTFVSEFERDGHRVIIALFSSESSEARFNEAKNLVDWIFNNYQWF